ncbi:MAG: alpha/beta hydrolase [Paludibacter sp.]|nr:alpha/beta hydrolase [Paludibacter sp.]
MKYLILWLLSIMTITINLSAQEEIKLYKNGPAETSGIVEKETINNPEFICNVTEARMYAYIVPKEKANGTAVLICPGGGYGGLAVRNEGSEVATWFNKLGITAFVLYYRMPNQHSDIPLTDAQTAMEIIRSSVHKWNIDKHKIGIIGFSAGGHLASTLGTHFMKGNRPDFMILVYPVISMTIDGTSKNLIGDNPSVELMKRFSNEKQVSKDTPPTLLIAAADDEVVSVEHSYAFYKALKSKNVQAEIKIYDKGGHGFGMKKSGLQVDNWLDFVKEWLIKCNYITTQ